MGEIADDMVNGLICEQCGTFIDGREPGYPRRCADCKKEKVTVLINEKGVKNASKPKHKRSN